MHRELRSDLLVGEFVKQLQAFPLAAVEHKVRIALLRTHIQFKIFAYSEFTHGEQNVSLHSRQ